MSKDIIKYSSLHSSAPEEGFLCRPTWQQSSKTTSAESHPSTMQSVFQSTTGGTGFSFLADPSTRSPLGQFSSLSAPIPVLSQERSCFRELTGSSFCCRDLSEEGGLESHRCPQDQQLPRPGPSVPAHEQAAHYCRDRRRAAWRSNGQLLLHLLLCFV